MKTWTELVEDEFPEEDLERDVIFSIVGDSSRYAVVPSFGIYRNELILTADPFYTEKQDYPGAKLSTMKDPILVLSEPVMGEAHSLIWENALASTFMAKFENCYMRCNIYNAPQRLYIRDHIAPTGLFLAPQSGRFEWGIRIFYWYRIG